MRRNRLDVYKSTDYKYHMCPYRRPVIRDYEDVPFGPNGPCADFQMGFCPDVPQHVYQSPEAELRKLGTDNFIQGAIEGHAAVMSFDGAKFYVAYKARIESEYSTQSVNLPSARSSA
jgi:hypothetical protein